MHGYGLFCIRYCSGLLTSLFCAVLPWLYSYELSYITHTITYFVYAYIIYITKSCNGHNGETSKKSLFGISKESQKKENYVVVKERRGAASKEA